MLLIDTSAWIEFFNHSESATAQKVELALASEIVLIGDLILCEILQGFKSQKDFEQVKKFLNKLMNISIGGKDLAIKSAQNYRYLRQKGVTVRKTIDVFIGTYCIENQTPLLHQDRDFKPMVEYLGLIDV